MKEEDNSKSSKKDYKAEEIAKIMVENMKKNMEDPDFWNKRERRLQEAADKVLKQRKLRQQEERD